MMLLFLGAAPAPVRLAIPNVSTINVSAESGAFFMDRFANRLRSHGVAVTTASEIDTVLGLERQKQLLGCQDSASCTAELAAALGVDAIARTRMANFSGKFEITVTVIDARDANVLASASRSAPDESKLLEVLDEVGDELAGRLAAWRAPHDAVVGLSANPGRRPLWVSLTPGAAGLVAGASGAVLLANSFKAVGDIATAKDPAAAADTARLDRVLGISLLGVGVAALATSVVLLIGGTTDTPVPVATVSAHGASIGVIGRFP
jgi:hypothetical protein